LRRERDDDVSVATYSTVAIRRVAARAREIERFGFRGLDALHLAAAEAGRADLLITTDDRILRRAGRAGAQLHLRVVRPAEGFGLLPLRDAE
jgi:hypothetical protein